MDKENITIKKLSMNEMFMAYVNKKANGYIQASGVKIRTVYDMMLDTMTIFYEIDMRRERK